jgi:SAM-dependent methyltransferase
MGRRVLYVAAESDPLHLHALRNRFLRTPNVVVQRLDPQVPEDLAGLESCFDTVLCLNVLEYAEDPEAIVRAVNTTLKPGGDLILLLPLGPGLFGSLDESLGHKRRFTMADARRILEAQGFAVEREYQFNKAGAPPWWFYSRVIRSKRISKLVLKVFDKTVWLWRRLDPVMPWPGLSLIAVGRKAERPAVSGESQAQRAAMPEGSHAG